MAESSVDRFGDEFGGERLWGLRELPYPDPVPLVPETVGWAVLAGVMLILLLYWGFRARRRWRANAYRRDAIASLEALDLSRSAELPWLLRKVALTAATRESVASLRGAAWIQWLNGSAGERMFEESDAHLLDQLIYSGTTPAAAEFERLRRQSCRWVKQHHA